MNISNKTTLIILDWDDTLFPTSWITKNNIELQSIKNKTNTENYQYFNKIDIALDNLFKIMLKCGDILIITNALINWITISASILPRLGKLLKSSNIKIVSARGEYQSISDNAMDWKKLAFDSELKNIMKDKQINNIISIGDAEYEYNALINLYGAEKKNYKLLKSVKFIRYPDNYQLLDQIVVLSNAIADICMKTGHLDLRFNEIS
jgi:hypothetical protein